MRPAPVLAAGGRTVANLLSSTEWMLPSPATQVHTVSVLPSHSPSLRHEFAFSNLATSLRNGASGKGSGELGSPRFYMVRDDLLHPLANGNKARKLDALLPLLRRRGATDIVRIDPRVTCGGCQSAHAAAVGKFIVNFLYLGTLCGTRNQAPYTAERRAAGCSDRVAGTNGTVIWADDVIIENLVVDEDSIDVNGSRRVVIVKEGAGSVQALLGVMRLVEYLSSLTLFGKDEKVHIVVDAGTGTTAVGLALGAVCLGLQWRVTAVMLADTLERYKEREKSLISDFKRLCHELYHGMVEDGSHDSLVQWVDRSSPRRFGKVLHGEIAMCREIAQQTGILLDPMYTLAGWEQAVKLCRGDSETKVVMIHTGGTLGLFGLAQRYSLQFTTDELRQSKGGQP
ncbi:hypothetical protein PR202_gb05098 [Eleusine coracana subsp. coracana]|uniref:D-cysteine desulfhydrase 2, mitochondrial n=1 Tax=Eleusine coracana subsp. coracana TaxID=191504 RepID=A0AAV5E5C3_ELECO|nr:hypothetical protein PR202_gb05098 [Eleusine coracana subsp. coracana]